MTALAPDPRVLTRRARDLVHSGRISAARPIIAALGRIAPGMPEVVELDARLLHHDGQAAEAEAVLTSGLAAAPHALSLLMCRAELRLQNGEPLGGADDAAAVVIANPAHAPAKALLGVALIQLGRFAEAVSCLREAVAAEPRHPAFREALAQAFERDDDRDAAMATLEQGISLMPGSVGLRVAAIMTALRKRDHVAAARLAEAARLAGVADARVFGLLGHSNSLLGRPEEASGAYEEALKLAPEDPYVRYLVAASGTLPPGPRAPSAYLETVFDGYASHFDAHLISLGYRIPGLIRAALLEHRPALRSGGAIGPMLDLGCGTGMVGVVVSDLRVERLVGIDLSARMLDQARAKQVYAELRQQDIEVALAIDGGGAADGGAGSAGETWDVIVAADSLCYFGQLDGVLAGAHAALRPGGLFVFSVEELVDARAPQIPWRLGPLGRYQHDAGALEAVAVAAGFTRLALRREILRHDRGTEIDGLILVLARPA
jgi:predicted TPR repeat methyltransferase